MDAREGGDINLWFLLFLPIRRLLEVLGGGASSPNARSIPCSLELVIAAR